MTSFVLFCFFNWKVNISKEGFKNKSKVASATTTDHPALVDIWHKQWFYSPCTAGELILGKVSIKKTKKFGVSSQKTTKNFLIFNIGILKTQMGVVSIF